MSPRDRAMFIVLQTMELHDFTGKAALHYMDRVVCKAENPAAIFVELMAERQKRRALEQLTEEA